MDAERQSRFREDNAKWLGGQRIAQLKFLHNSTVEAILPGGTKRRGWVVAAWLSGPEPMYTVEYADGTGDIQCAESSLKTVDNNSSTGIGSPLAAAPSGTPGRTDDVSSDPADEHTSGP